jgi:hypothetical protein
MCHALCITPNWAMQCRVNWNDRYSMALPFKNSNTTDFLETGRHDIREVCTTQSRDALITYSE